MICRSGAALATLVAVVAAPRAAGADGEIGLVSPRAGGKAGAALVSDDGPAALFTCPAAIARRDERRAQVAGLFVDDDVWLETPDHPRISDRGPSELVPLAGVIGTLGPLVIGVGVATTASIDRRLPAPAPGLPSDTVVADFPHRYAALETRWTRRTVAVGAAARATEWLAIGASATLSRIDAVEGRRMWAGIGGRDRPLGVPVRDIAVEIAAHDALVPGAALGVLVAPADVPLELALGASWSGEVRAAGDASVSWGRTPAPTGSPVLPPTVEAGGARATGRFASPLVLHAGVRWIGERYAIEGGAIARTYPDDGDDGWQLDGARVVDDSGAARDLEQMATRIGRRSHAGLRAGVDVALFPGFLWLSAGYGWRGAGQATRTTTIGGVDAGGHTLAFGAELTAGRAVMTLGWSRQLARTTTVGAGVGGSTASAGIPWDNPLGAEALPANLGDHGHSRDVVGVGLELAMP